MKKIILYTILAFTISCRSNDKAIPKAEHINIKTLVTVNRLPNSDPQADTSQINDFEDAFENYQDQFNFNSLLLTSRRWVVKNDLNGRAISRERIAAITSKLDNKCFIQHFIFKQDADGSGFDNSYISEGYGWKKIECELIK